MSDWDAALYRQFERERTRPAADLLAQCPVLVPRHIVDLGCGPGNSTELLVRRFPDAAVTGVDLSPSMLASARERLQDCRFEAADIATWKPATAPDLIFANAALQWVPDHAALLPRLMGQLAPGGILAIQMPDNRNEPSHAAMRQVASEALGAASFAGTAAATRLGILGAEEYYDFLAPRSLAVDIWRTTYHHKAFLARYEALIDVNYPPRADGKRLLAFPRLFIIAQAPT